MIRTLDEIAEGALNELRADARTMMGIMLASTSSVKKTQQYLGLFEDFLRSAERGDVDFARTYYVRIFETFRKEGN